MDLLTLAQSRPRNARLCGCYKVNVEGRRCVFKAWVVPDTTAKRSAVAFSGVHDSRGIAIIFDVPADVRCL